MSSLVASPGPLLSELQWVFVIVGLVWIRFIPGITLIILLLFTGRTNSSSSSSAFRGYCFCFPPFYYFFLFSPLFPGNF